MDDTRTTCVKNLITTRQCLVTQGTIRGLIYSHIFLENEYDSFEEGVMLKYEQS